ncbi:MAG: hypothetical protein HY673_12860 [Chloroflexi bacterium]|nr:hypothetical protein [Chloroflexota bacterium]
MVQAMFGDRLASGVFPSVVMLALMALIGNVARAAHVEVNKPVSAFVVVVPQTASSLRGDIDANGVVDILDLALITANFNTAPPRFRLADLNPDGILDIFDLTLAGVNYGTGGAR